MADVLSEPVDWIERIYVPGLGGGGEGRGGGGLSWLGFLFSEAMQIWGSICIFQLYSWNDFTMIVTARNAHTVNNYRRVDWIESIAFGNTSRILLPAIMQIGTANLHIQMTAVFFMAGFLSVVASTCNLVMPMSLAS